MNNYYWADPVLTGYDYVDRADQFSGPGDSVKCFQCGGVLKKWSEADEPWTEHAKWFPDCLFLLQQKGYQFINHIQQQFRGSGGFNNIQVRSTESCV